jgi:tellurite resistance protein
MGLLERIFGPTSSSDYRSALMTATCLVAVADRTVTDSEREAMIGELGAAGIDDDVATRLVEQGLRTVAAKGVRGSVDSLPDTLDEHEREEVVIAAMTVAVEDGERTPEEHEVLGMIAAKLGFGPERMAEIWERHGEDMRKAVSFLMPVLRRCATTPDDLEALRKLEARAVSR